MILGVFLGTFLLIIPSVTGNPNQVIFLVGFAAYFLRFMLYELIWLIALEKLFLEFTLTVSFDLLLFELLFFIVLKYSFFIEYFRHPIMVMILCHLQEMIFRLFWLRVSLRLQVV